MPDQVLEPYIQASQRYVLQYFILFYFFILGIYFSFWYYIYDDNPTPSSPSLKVTMVRGTTDTDLLEIEDPKTDDWKTATAFIGNRPGEYKVSKISCTLLNWTWAW